MAICSVVRRCVPVLLLSSAIATTGARADSAAATRCAGGLSKDAKAIFDATLPQVTKGSDLRALLTTNTRSLVFAGTINRATARDAATAAGACLKRAGT